MTGFTDVFRAKILIVDDQECNVRLLEHTLRRGGYLSLSSTTDPVAVAALQRANCYDLIILDLQMPRMNGFAVMATLLDLGEAATVLILSADPSQMVPALEAGARSFLSKPFLLPALLERVGSLLEKTMSSPALAQRRGG